MPRVKTTPYDAADYIETPEDAVAYLDAALEDGDPRVVAGVISAIVRSKATAGVATSAGLSRENLLDTLSPDHELTLGATLQVLAALGLRLTAAEQKSAA